jgi:hypothetical protein
MIDVRRVRRVAFEAGLFCEDDGGGLRAEREGWLGRVLLPPRFFSYHVRPTDPHKYRQISPWLGFDIASARSAQRIPSVHRYSNIELHV